MSGKIKSAPKNPSAYFKAGLTKLSLGYLENSPWYEKTAKLADKFHQKEGSPHTTMAAVFALKCREVRYSPIYGNVALAFGCTEPNLNERMNALAEHVLPKVQEAKK